MQLQKPLTPLKIPYPNWYKTYCTYENHVGTARHHIHSCTAFEKWLMHLIKIKWATFEETPTMSINPLPNDSSRSGLVDPLEE